MRQIAFSVMFLGIPTLVFAQDGGGGGIDLDLKQIIATLIIGVGIPLAVQILKQLWPGAPGWLKTFLPIIVGPLLGWAGQALTVWLGIPIDFGPILDVIMGGAALGVASTVAFKLGKRDPKKIKNALLLKKD